MPNHSIQRVGPTIVQYFVFSCSITRTWGNFVKFLSSVSEYTKVEYASNMTSTIGLSLFIKELKFLVKPQTSLEDLKLFPFKNNGAEILVNTPHHITDLLILLKNIIEWRTYMTIK